MLEELTAYKTFGSSGHLAAIARAISGSACTVNDLFVIAESDSIVEIPRVDDVVALLRELGLCTIEDMRVMGSLRLDAIVDDSLPVGTSIGLILLRRMIDEGILPTEKIQYDPDARCAYLRLHDIPIRYSQMRNYLIESDVLIVDEDRLLFSQCGLRIVQEKAATLERGMTPEELLRKLERDRETGAEAEAFVMEYERRRLGESLADAVQQVSLISVSAGYDIASFAAVDSKKYDRFIEVKAIGKNGFYLSANELQEAKKRGKQYCLYLVDMLRKDQKGYEPEIIQDPLGVLIESGDWRIVPESYHVARIM